MRPGPGRRDARGHRELPEDHPRAIIAEKLYSDVNLMRLNILLAALVVLIGIYLFWSRNVITRVPGYTTPIGQTPSALQKP